MADNDASRGNRNNGSSKRGRTGRSRGQSSSAATRTSGGNLVVPVNPTDSVNAVNPVNGAHVQLPLPASNPGSIVRPGASHPANFNGGIAPTGHGGWGGFNIDHPQAPSQENFNGRATGAGFNMFRPPYLFAYPSYGPPFTVMGLSPNGDPIPMRVWTLDVRSPDMNYTVRVTCFPLSRSVDMEGCILSLPWGLYRIISAGGTAGEQGRDEGTGNDNAGCEQGGDDHAGNDGGEAVDLEL